MHSSQGEAAGIWSPLQRTTRCGERAKKNEAFQQLQGLVNADVKISVTAEKSHGSERDKWEGVGRLLEIVGRQPGAVSFQGGDDRAEGAAGGEEW